MNKGSGAAPPVRSTPKTKPASSVTADSNPKNNRLAGDGAMHIASVELVLADLASATVQAVAEAADKVAADQCVRRPSLRVGAAKVAEAARAELRRRSTGGPGTG